MSLSRLSAQLCAVQALRGKTIVADNVRDSETGLIQIDQDGNIKTDEQKPFINVFSDDVEAKIDGRRLMASGRLAMTFEFGITGSMPLVTAEGRYLLDENGEIVTAERTKPSDAEINILVEIIERQIRVALSDPENAWAELWREFMIGDFKIESARAASDKNGVRFGARRLRVTSDLLPDLPYRAEVKSTSTWQRFLDALPGSQIAHLQSTFEDLMGIGETELDHEQLRRRFGLTRGEARSLLHAPPEAAEATEPTFAGAETFSTERVSDAP